MSHQITYPARPFKVTLRELPDEPHIRSCMTIGETYIVHDLLKRTSYPHNEVEFLVSTDLGEFRSCFVQASKFSIDAERVMYSVITPVCGSYPSCLYDTIEQARAEWVDPQIICLVFDGKKLKSVSIVD